MKQKLLFAFIISQAFFGANAQQFGSRTVLNSSLHRHSSFVFHDIDDDGDIDILATTSTGTVSSSANQVCWYKNLGNETFSARTMISSAYEDVTTVRLLDVDEDGKKDLVIGDREIGLSWIKNMGSGFFGTKQDLPYNSYLTTFEVGDMNNDGKEDIIVAQLNGDSLHFVRNTGNGTFVYDSMIYAITDNIYSIAFGDLDQDQVTDLIVSTGGTTTQKIIKFEYVNNAFVQSFIYSSPTSPYVYQSFLYDVDNDGKDDVVTGSSDCGSYWFKNFGNNVYSGITPLSMTNCNNYNFGHVADLDLDGFQDLVYFRYGQINYKNGTGIGELSTTITSITGNSAIEGEIGRTNLFDIDEDGDLDVFYSTDNEFGWFMNNASALSTPESEAVKFMVYPNPATSELNIVSIKAVDSYKIYDNAGKLVANATFSNAITDCKIDLGQLSSGFYFIDIQSGSSREIKKFVKN
ncbi:T9SS type A sorting domain-containing protein [Flavobacterium sp. MAH-1]|uniref:T9SS type A sorting domain-containing protein n=1 Tax=Flavobacterium agri TaxID=2743471 RepID=A0A7Y9C7I5_9FLAO|nr:T9SS type A sorting domain-containing protein [Flavobacterium agri]NUY81454.1 T9SS type A sorting domain-containing protein [Flavobacterium agri]NYA71478.1 T9SS type A sorting domain-containing protein [Flavobacterium agri]